MGPTPPATRNGRMTGTPHDLFSTQKFEANEFPNSEHRLTQDKRS